MQLNKKYIIGVISSILLTVMFCLCWIIIELSKGNSADYASIYVPFAENDSTSFSSQIDSNDKLLVLYFHPECDFCKGELNSLARMDMPELVVDLISFAPKDSIDALLQNIEFPGIGEVNLLYDSLFVWHNKLNIKLIPTTFYFEHGELIQKRTGYFKLEKLLYDEK